jgi:hypothetical protein
MQAPISGLEFRLILDDLGEAIADSNELRVDFGSH